MSELLQMSASNVLRALASFGFAVIKIKGSHAKLRRVLKHGERQTLSVPIHRSIAPGALRAIYRQALRFIPEEDLKPWFFHQHR
jgi:predicted RNA binding protein YcfA (HicA-like mRNA interferase family)